MLRVLGGGVDDVPSFERVDEGVAQRPGGRLSRLTAVLVNAGSSILRAWAWNGGSEEIGGEPPTGARSRGGRKLPMMIDREEKRSVS